MPDTTPHAKGHGKYLLPVFKQGQVGLITGFQPQAIEHREIAGQPDGECRKHDVKRHRERELSTRKQFCRDAIKHRSMFPVGLNSASPSA